MLTKGKFKREGQRLRRAFVAPQVLWWGLGKTGKIRENNIAAPVQRGEEELYIDTRMEAKVILAGCRSLIGYCKMFRGVRLLSSGLLCYFYFGLPFDVKYSRICELAGGRMKDVIPSSEANFGCDDLS